MENDKIFIAIASLLDPELPITINDCIIKSDNPENLSFGVCWQYDNDNKEVSENILDFYEDKFNIRIIKYDWRQSKGGCWARQIAQSLHKDEHYHLQIDSHTRLVKGWDTKCKTLINQLKEKSPKPYISFLPALYIKNREYGVDSLYEQLHEMDMVNVPKIKYIAPDGHIHFGAYDNKKILKEPIKTPILYGGFIFSESNWIKDIEQDPNHYYAGEELALAIRSYTHGYDCYLPTELFAWHIGNGGYIPKHYTHISKTDGKEEHMAAMVRLNMLFNGEDLGKYGLGNERSLSEYEQFLKVDLKNRKIYE